jgi:hypothetical protein
MTRVTRRFVKKSQIFSSKLIRTYIHNLHRGKRQPKHLRQFFNSQNTARRKQSPKRRKFDQSDHRTMTSFCSNDVLWPSRQCQLLRNRRCTPFCSVFNRKKTDVVSCRNLEMITLHYAPFIALAPIFWVRFFFRYKRFFNGRPPLYQTYVVLSAGCKK